MKGWTLDQIGQKIKAGTLPGQQDLFADISSVDKPESINIPEVNNTFVSLSFEIPKMLTKEGGFVNPLPKQGDKSYIAIRPNARKKIINGFEYYRKKDLYVAHYIDKIKVDWEGHIRTHVRAQLPPDFVMWEHEVHVEHLEFIFAPTTQFSEKEKAAVESGMLIYKTTAPDLTDNLAKPLFDAMENLVYKRDSLICLEKGLRLKRYGKEPGVIVKLSGR